MAFSDLLGQNEVKEKLNRVLETGKLGHAYIFTGERGIGKKTFAREFISAAMCTNRHGSERCCKCKSCTYLESENNPDLLVISADDGKSVISVDRIRDDIREAVSKAPNFSAKRVVLVESAEKMNEAAQNALLKTFEEPPEYAMIILLCDNLLQMLETIKSRAVIVELRRNTNEEILAKYRKKQGGAAASSGDVTPELVCSYADGIMGRIDEIMNDGDAMESRRTLSKLLPGLFEGSIEAKNSIMDLIDVKSKKYDFVFFSIISFVRDAMVLSRFGMRTKIINADFRDALHALGGSVGYYRLKNALETIDECYKNLAKNANAELAVDNMLIKLGMRTASGY
ncbi:MAG: hypothetical protein K6B54_03520 [Clostridia bacterium]|nr:hypothetical protein [Clostridia bacterium]